LKKFDTSKQDLKQKLLLEKEKLLEKPSELIDPFQSTVFKNVKLDFKLS